MKRITKPSVTTNVQACRAVTVVDIEVPSDRSLTIVRKMRHETPEMLLLALVPATAPDIAVLAIEAGASGCLCDDASVAELELAFQQLQSGFAPLCFHLAHAVLDAIRSRSMHAECPRPSLTRREKEILTLLSRGHAYASVACALGIGIGTVQTYVRRLYRKLDVASKAEAAALAVRYGWADA